MISDIPKYCRTCCITGYQLTKLEKIFKKWYLYETGFQFDASIGLRYFVPVNRVRGLGQLVENSWS